MTENRASEALPEGAILLDVRTPEEYAAGHLEGAERLDLTGGEFADALPQLDPEAEYFVYCHAGGRAARALEQMSQAGFERLTNLGGVADAAAATGIAIVTD